ncbi:MAG: outer membrane lipoprotein chaperone LolA [Sulfurospirillum sp.]|nr:outer membrane lipoprotein chaperone LolA [Sulfurospirillum sp.]MBL0703483.1 outer membrane lipoprotein chaperone LolA [Sulfurospirillum sp.]
MRLFMAFLLTCNILIAQVFDFDTISSDFKQTITNEENSKIVYTGSFYASSKAKALWIYTTPIKKKIYFSQDKVTIIEPELEQAIITNLKNIPNLTEIFKNAKNIDDNIYETTYGDITYTMHEKNGTIDMIAYSDQLENRVLIEFFNQSINTFLNDSIFKAIVPHEFDIIMQ